MVNTNPSKAFDEPLYDRDFDLAKNRQQQQYELD